MNIINEHEIIKMKKTIKYYYGNCKNIVNDYTNLFKQTKLVKI